MIGARAQPFCSCTAKVCPWPSQPTLTAGWFMRALANHLVHDGLGRGERDGIVDDVCGGNASHDRIGFA